MLERSVFKDYLFRIRDCQKIMTNMLDALDPYGIRIDGVPCFDAMFDIAVSELQRLMHDKNDTIFYYICNLDWGSSTMAECCIVRKSTNDAWSLRTPDELYDYLEQMYNEGKKE